MLYKLKIEKRLFGKNLKSDGRLGKKSMGVNNSVKMTAKKKRKYSEAFDDS